MLPIHFAPLQGYTEAPYRCIHHEVCGGVEAYYTPFIRLEHGQIRKKDLREALPEQNRGVNIIPQVIAADAAEFEALARKLIELGHRHVNVNMCCPFPLQTRLGRGSGLLPRVEQVRELLLSLKSLHDETGAEFSVKMRLGQNAADECMALLPLLNEAPLSYVIMHPRLGCQQYKGELDYDAFDRFLQGCKHPMIFNGMLTTVEEIQQLEQRYPQLVGVMIGRGLLSRPTLAAEYAVGKPMSDDEVRLKVREMHRRLIAHYEQAIEGGESQLVMKMHSFWDYMEPLFGHKGVKKVLKSGSLRNYLAAVASL